MTLVVRARRWLLGAVLSLPAAARRRLLGTPPRNDRGTVLDVDTWTMLRLAELVAPPLAISSPQVARAGLRADIATVESRPRPVGRLEALTLPGGAAARLYLPPEPGRPLLVFLHGGGWVIGDLDTADGFCRRVCAEVGWGVLSVDYRLAPEHPFPAGLDDALDAIRHAQRHAAGWGCDPERIAVGGDSAGGNLSAAACLVLRDEGAPLPWQQVLIYPATDAQSSNASRKHFDKGYILTGEKIRWFLDQYSPEERADPRISPLRAEELSGLPPALVVTAGFDPLRDEGEAYAARLQEAGVEVELIDAADMVHGFIAMDGLIPAADRWLAVIVDALARRGVSIFLDTAR